MKKFLLRVSLIPIIAVWPIMVIIFGFKYLDWLSKLTDRAFKN